MAERLKEWGVNNVMVSGTTGESVSLTADERKMLAEEWITNLVSVTNISLLDLMQPSQISRCFWVKSGKNQLIRLYSTFPGSQVQPLRVRARGSQQSEGGSGYG